MHITGQGLNLDREATVTQVKRWGRRVFSTQGKSRINGERIRT